MAICQVGSATKVINNIILREKGRKGKGDLIIPVFLLTFMMKEAMLNAHGHELQEVKHCVKLHYNGCIKRRTLHTL